MASTGESGCPGSGFCGLLKKLGLVPDASQGRFHSAVAVYGASSYGLLAVNVFNPELIARSSLSKDLTNAAMGGALIAGSFYLFKRPHLASLGKSPNRIFLSMYGSTLVTMGSVLTWAFAARLLPDNPALKTAAAVCASYFMLRAGISYLDIADGKFEKEE